MLGKNFNGFSPALFDFLVELSFNNNKGWFDQNRDRYKVLFKEPMDLLALDLIEKIRENMPEIDFSYSISRINRDVRFSKNKEPYKTSKWITFKTASGTCTELPVMFFEVTPSSYIFGMGIYCSSAQTMKNYRNRIDANTGEVNSLIEIYKSQSKFVLEGEQYKRNLSGYEGELKNWYQMKNFALVSYNDIDESIFDGSVVDQVVEGFKFLLPFFTYWQSIANC